MARTKDLNRRDAHVGQSNARVRHADIREVRNLEIVFQDRCHVDAATPVADVNRIVEQAQVEHVLVLIQRMQQRHVIVTLQRCNELKLNAASRVILAPQVTHNGNLGFVTRARLVLEYNAGVLALKALVDATLDVPVLLVIDIRCAVVDRRGMTKVKSKRSSANRM